MKASEILKKVAIKKEDISLEEELKGMKDVCVSCKEYMGYNVRRFRTSGNYCSNCTVKCDRNWKINGTKNINL